MLMATYKVPQDVEADDKLLGPFSFKQFIFLLIAVGLGALAYFLSTIFLPLFIIPLPFGLFFLVLSLPLRKDQPVEVYLAAIISFYIKPRKKIWQPDGIIQTIEFDDQVPQEQELPANMSYEEASQRLSFLSNVIDTQGRSVSNMIAKSPLQDTVVSESTQIEDFQDPTNQTNQNFDRLLKESRNNQRQQIRSSISSSSPAPSQAEIKAEARELASNDTLSIETLSHEMRRRQRKRGLIDQDNNLSLRK